MDRPRLTRWLRITASAMFLILCGLLIVLWVRSYSWMEQVSGPLSQTRHLRVNSIEGGLLVQLYYHPSAYRDRTWRVGGQPRMRPGVSPSPFRIGSEFRLIDRGVEFPHWFLVLLSAALAYVPWLPWWSIRFSIKTLLILTAVVAACLGLIVWMVR